MMLITSQALLWLTVFCLAVSMLALARQVGVIHARIAPVGALSIGRGPQPGESGPELTATTLSGGSIKVGGAAHSPSLVFFVSATCPVCKSLMPTVIDVVKSEGLDLIVVGDGEQTELRQMADRFKLPATKFVNSMEVGRAYHVGKLPYAVLLDSSGVISAQGLVNTREHVESLVVAYEEKVPSLQAYVKKYHFVPPANTQTGDS
ncbi:methylamine utilization protein MauD [Pseudomonas jessenii]|uniref:Methylamine utilization protein MauD n=1 Tax=Pseudomonas jessenii TaxID=77298 RepID=A0A2W0FHF4_PSEJE|nr:redoxin domain-containing protein [Pseudomonas jessenii]PYY72474.1 methylamine utilization protein MauD [Pseudomonas jessenii]